MWTWRSVGMKLPNKFMGSGMLPRPYSPYSSYSPYSPYSSYSPYGIRCAPSPYSSAAYRALLAPRRTAPPGTAYRALRRLSMAPIIQISHSTVPPLPSYPSPSTVSSTVRFLIPSSFLPRSSHPPAQVHIPSLPRCAAFGRGNVRVSSHRPKLHSQPHFGDPICRLQHGSECYHYRGRADSALEYGIRRRGSGSWCVQ